LRPALFNICANASTPCGVTGFAVGCADPADDPAAGAVFAVVVVGAVTGAVFAVVVLPAETGLGAAGAKVLPDSAGLAAPPTVPILPMVAISFIFIMMLF
jgi:hypothetical protein